MTTEAALPSWVEHIDLVQSIVVASVLVLAWAARQWLQSQTNFNKSITDEQKTIHGRITHVDNRLNRLEGAHNANHPNANH